MEAQVDEQGRLACAAVAIAHHVAARRDQHIIGLADERLSAFFLDGREVLNGRDAGITGRHDLGPSAWLPRVPQA